MLLIRVFPLGLVVLTLLGCRDGRPDHPPSANLVGNDLPAEEKAKLPADEGLASEPVYLPGGIADDSGTTGFLANADLGIDAVDLESGKLLWQSKAGCDPLAIHKEHLVVLERQGNKQVRLLALNISEKGKIAWVTEPISTNVDRDKYYFRRKVEGSHLRLPWGYSVNMVTGKLTPFGGWPHFQEGRLAKEYADIATVASDPKAFGPTNILPKVPWEKLEDPEPRVVLDSEDPLKKPGEDGYYLRKRWLTPDTLNVLTSVHHREFVDDVLISWDLKTGKNLRTVRVASGSKVHGGSHVLHLAHGGRSLVTVGGKSSFDQYYGVFAVESGESFGFKIEAAANKHRWPGVNEDVWAVGPRFFYAIDGERRTLKAMDMTTQKLLWSRSISNTYAHSIDRW